MQYKSATPPQLNQSSKAGNKNIFAMAKPFVKFITSINLLALILKHG